MPLLQCSPANEIPFTADNVGEETSILKLSNTGEETVAYKVKTTAQKKYLVSPSNGILKLGESVDVHILLQARFQPAEKEDRFMVLAVKTTSTEKLSRDEWNAQTGVEDTRLKVVLRSKGSGSAEPAKGGAKKSDLQSQYEELFAYTLELERKKKQADSELESLQSSLGGSLPSSKGVPLYGLVFAMLVSAFAARYVDLGF